MSIGDWPRLWALSAATCGKGGLGALKRRLTFMAAAACLGRPLRPWLHAPAGSALQRAVAQRPELLGVIVWPFVCANWGGAERLDRLAAHFGVAESRLPVLDLDASAQRRLVDLGDAFEGLRLVLDRPPWFMREGPLVLNLFIGETRIYSLAFTLSEEPQGLVAYIGAIQGVAGEGIQDDYKGLTKALHGMRPRDFIVESFRSLCRALGVAGILAVADASRQHRSAYFGAAKAAKLGMNYDDVWLERGGMAASADFFRLEVTTPVRNLDEVPSKKRAMYRRRYELLQSVDERMRCGLADPAAVRSMAPAGAVSA